MGRVGWRLRRSAAFVRGSGAWDGASRGRLSRPLGKLSGSTWRALVYRRSHLLVGVLVGSSAVAPSGGASAHGSLCSFALPPSRLSRLFPVAPPFLALLSLHSASPPPPPSLSLSSLLSFSLRLVLATLTRYRRCHGRSRSSLKKRDVKGEQPSDERRPNVGFGILCCSPKVKLPVPRMLDPLIMRPLKNLRSTARR